MSWETWKKGMFNDWRGNSAAVKSLVFADLQCLNCSSHHTHQWRWTCSELQGCETSTVVLNLGGQVRMRHRTLPSPLLPPNSVSFPSTSPLVPIFLCSPQPVEADGRQSWVWFCWRFLPDNEGVFSLCSLWELLGFSITLKLLTFYVKCL